MAPSDTELNMDDDLPGAHPASGLDEALQTAYREQLIATGQWPQRLVGELAGTSNERLQWTSCGMGKTAVLQQLQRMLEHDKEQHDQSPHPPCSPPLSPPAHAPADSSDEEPGRPRAGRELEGITR